MATKKEVEKYMKYPWTFTIKPEEDYFVAYVNELPKVASDGSTVEEAIANAKEAIYGTIDLMLDMGMPIPVPSDPKYYKGKIPYRTDSDVHYQIALLASKKHMSVNKTLDWLVREGLKRENIR